jgi:16S rRNA (guanine527-N7)-methyltransferase
MDDGERERFIRTLTEASEAGGILVSAERAALCLRFAARMLTVNETMNLTRIVAPEAVAIKHFADSLAVLPVAGRLPVGASVIDVGTGAGFPGVPMKIVRPDLKLTLLDSLAKRLRFLDAACAELGFTDVKTVHARAEDAAKNPLYRGKFDLVTARAVAALPTLLEWCAPFVAPGGRFVALKSGNVDEERDAATPVAARLGLTLVTDHALTLPQLPADEEPPRRRLLVYKKGK